MIRWIALVFVWPVMALADWPGLYDVTGVAADDVLNIRSDARAQSDVIGQLAHNATRVEIIDTSENGRWGRVAAGERSGWVAMRFLSLQDKVDPAQGLNCFGTEPFWTLTLAQDGKARYTNPDFPAFQYSRIASGISANRTDRWFFTGKARVSTVTAIVQAQLCDDGMSDRDYAMSVDVIFNADHLLSGCCKAP